MRRIVLGYSGSHETSLAIPWLAGQYGADVIAVTLDVGQGGELADVQERALALGVVRAHVLDARDELVRHFVLPSLHVGGLNERPYPPTALSVPLIAQQLVSIARMEGADAIAHAGTGSGDRLRMQSLVRALDGSIDLIYISEDIVAAARAEHSAMVGMFVPHEMAGWHVDANLWGRTIRSRNSASSFGELSDDIWTLTRASHESPDAPAFVDVEFDSGVPVRINGIDMPLLDMIESLETIGGSHGVGRLYSTLRSQSGDPLEYYEAPAAVILHSARQALRARAAEVQLASMERQAEKGYASIILTGGWFSQAREAIDALMAVVQPSVTGSVRLRLLKGSCSVVAETAARGAENALTPDAVQP